MDEELTQKFQEYERQIVQIQKELQVVEQATVDLGKINLGLDDITGNKGSEILAPLGKGIFIKAKLESEDLIVDIGEGNMVKKTVSETKELIEEQIGKLKDIREDLEGELDNINNELTKSMSDFYGKDSEENTPEQ